MRRRLGVMALCLAATSCAAPPEPAPPACPPLPMLIVGATPAQRQQHHERVISLYADCARSQR